MAFFDLPELNIPELVPSIENKNGGAKRKRYDEKA